MKRLLLIFLLSIIGSSVQAQIEPPLIGPLLAMNTVAQDEIIIYDVGSDTYRSLTLGEGAHHIWDFSSDGCRLLLTLTQGAQHSRLVTANLDASAVRQMVQFDELPPERWGIWEPDWSPDGSRIAFTMLRERGPGSEAEIERHIAFVTPDNPQPQFYSVTGRESSPQWSPDSRWLAYISVEERAAGADVFATAVPTLEPPPGQTPTPPVLVNEADIWVVSADAETKYKLTDFPTGSVSQPRWSPDSELLSFVYSPSGNNDMVWMIANQQDAIPTQLMFQWSLVLDNTWLPDSTAVLGALRDFREVNENRLWEIPLLGNADENGSQFLQDVDLSHADFPRFSANGNWLAARSAYQMALVDLQSGHMRLLDEQTVSNSAGVWSPEGFNGESSCRN